MGIRSTDQQTLSPRGRLVTKAPTNSRHEGDRHEGEEDQQGRRQEAGQEGLLRPAAGGDRKSPSADLFRLPRGDPLALVDDAVETWARHQIAAPSKLGYAESDGTCRNATSSETWDTATEILERRVDAMVIDAVEGALPSLDGRQRAIVWAVYANRIGPAVWRSQWLSRMTPGELVTLHRGALTTLRPLLRQRGLVV